MRVKVYALETGLDDWQLRGVFPTLDEAKADALRRALPAHPAEVEWVTREQQSGRAWAAAGLPWPAAITAWDVEFAMAPAERRP